MYKILLDYGRSCLRYIIRTYCIDEIFVPFYTCPVVWQTLKEEHCKVKFYHIDINFMPILDFPQNAYVIYTNYFGICSKNVINLSKKYKNLIVDNSQAFYMHDYGIASFNSIRKFFKVYDGATLSINKKYTSKIDKLILNPLKMQSSKGDSSIISDYSFNEEGFKTTDIRLISEASKAIIDNINVEKAKQKRLENFKILHNVLCNTNKLFIDLLSFDVPMVYPYFVEDVNLRKKLIKNKIYVDIFWNPHSINTLEGKMQKYIIPLPLNQSYGIYEMNKIINIIFN